MIRTLPCRPASKFSAASRPEFAEILTPQALAFIAKLARKFEPRRRELLEPRATRQAEFDAGKLARFPAGNESASARPSGRSAPVPRDLQDRRVEITGPTDRKMVINALNSGASVFMADFEDANTPTWENMIDGQINLRDAVNRTIEYSEPRRQALPAERQDRDAARAPARLASRREARATSTASRCRASIFDFALYFFHNAKALLARDSGPYFYLPKMESHLEARLWNDVFVAAQRELGIPQGTIKATVLIETDARRVRDGRDPVRAARALAPGSTSGAGTTSSAASRNSGPTRISASPTARRSP